MIILAQHFADISIFTTFAVCVRNNCYLPKNGTFTTSTYSSSKICPWNWIIFFSNHKSILMSTEAVISFWSMLSKLCSFHCKMTGQCFFCDNCFPISATLFLNENCPWLKRRKVVPYCKTILSNESRLCSQNFASVFAIIGQHAKYSCTKFPFSREFSLLKQFFRELGKGA